MDELSRSRGSEGIRACDDASHTVTSRENVLHRFPGRRGFSALKGTPPDPRAEYLLKRGNRY